MDELYGDLENYNEVNALEELRNENKDLKLRLEEYETAMGQLQKDYDKLAIEFNNLQMNYSSLLKTARAEVERKAQMITQLNLEKDMMVLKALQNGNNRRFQNNHNKFQKNIPCSNKSSNANSNKTTNSNNVESSKLKVGKKDRNELQQKTLEVKNERLTNSVSANPSVTSCENAKLLNIVDNVMEQVGACISKGELKENVSCCMPDHKESLKGHSSSIKVSVPVVTIPKCNSYEDCGSEKSTNLTRHKEPQKEISEKRNINTNLTRICQEQLSNRTSETSSTDGRGSNYQEEYKSRTSRSYSEKARDTDRYREVDRQSDRYRDRDKLRDAGRVKEVDKYWEGDKYRESGKPRDHDRFRERDRHRDSGKHRESDKYRDGDKHRDFDRFRGRDKYESRHKKQLPDRPQKRNFKEHQEDHKPEFGRYRLASPPPDPQNSYHLKSQDNRSHHESNNHDNDKFKNHVEQRYAEKLAKTENRDVPNSKRLKIDSEVHDSENRRHSDRQPLTRPSRNEMYDYDMLHASCQSPDAVFSPDSNTEAIHPHTVLEIKNTPTTELEDPRVTSKKYELKDENGKTTLSAAGSKNIDIKPIDKSLWSIESVVVPEALLHEPKLQFNEENIKEIYMDIDNLEPNLSVESGEIDSDAEGILSNAIREKKSEKDLQIYNVNKPATDTTPMQKTNPVQIITSTYRIPKLKQSTQKIVSEISVAKNLPEINCDARSIKNQDLKDKKCLIKPESKLPLIEEHDDLVATSNANVKVYENNTNDQNQITLSEIAMVQDDLELSDETSDNLELQRQLILEKINDLGNKTKSDFKIKPDEQVDNAKIINAKTDDKTTEPNKKHKNKRRKTKSKEKELGENFEDIHFTEKKAKCKKEKEPKPKQIKNKFSDLFGDSSSLITPEDLGIPTSCVPMCEDAQDAVDINFKEIVKAPPPYTKETCDENEEHKIHLESTQDTYISNPNTEDKELAKRIEEQIASPDVDTNIGYKNLNAEMDTNKPDVVKTVIISSGVQPQFVLDDMESKMEKRVADVEVNIQNIVDCYQLPAVTEFKKQNSMKALATSTPQKDCTVLSTIESDSRATNSCNDSNSVSVDTVRQAANQSNTNIQETHDAPDVRIFVRRRRKGVKKT